MPRRRRTEQATRRTRATRDRTGEALPTTLRRRRGTPRAGNAPRPPRQARTRGGRRAAPRASPLSSIRTTRVSILPGSRVRRSGPERHSWKGSLCRTSRAEGREPPAPAPLPFRDPPPRLRGWPARERIPDIRETGPPRQAGKEREETERGGRGRNAPTASGIGWEPVES